MSEPLVIRGETWADVESRPTTINGVHQSCYRSDYVLRCIKRLVRMGATSEVIAWFLDGLEDMPQRGETR